MTGRSNGFRTARTAGGSARWIGSPALWDAITGQAVAVLGGHAENFTALFMPDGRRLVIGLDRRVCLFDTATGRELALLGRHDHRVLHLAVTSDGKRIATHGEHEDDIR